MKLRDIFIKKKKKKPGEGIKPKGVAHSVVPNQWLQEWKYNDLDKVFSKKITTYNL